LQHTPLLYALFFIRTARISTRCTSGVKKKLPPLKIKEQESSALSDKAVIGANPIAFFAFNFLG
jgi:hypothetical protein